MTVELADLEARIVEFGPRAFLVTVGTDPRPHVVSAVVSYVDGRLIVGAGRRTRANLEQNPSVVLLWPGAADARLSLIVDGIVDDVDQLAEPDNDLSVQPLAAVLHRIARRELGMTDTQMTTDRPGNRSRRPSAPRKPAGS
jgi:hypothetical protein